MTTVPRAPPPGGGGSPFRERRLRPAEVQRVIRRAVALSSGSESAPSLTEREIEEKLAELGVPRAAIRRALVEPEPIATPPAVGDAHVVHEVVLAAELRPEDHERVVDVIQASMGMVGRVEIVGGRITWTPRGLALEPTVTVHAKPRRTILRVEQTLANHSQRIAGAFVVAALSGLFGLLPGIAVAKALRVSSTTSLVLVALTALTCAVAAFTSMRRYYARHVSARTHALGDAMHRIGAAIEAIDAERGDAARGRVSASPDGAAHAPKEPSAEEEALAEAEADQIESTLAVQNSARAQRS